MGTHSSKILIVHLRFGKILSPMLPFKDLIHLAFLVYYTRAHLKKYPYRGNEVTVLSMMMVLSDANEDK